MSIQMDEDPREEKTHPTQAEGLKKVQIVGPSKVHCESQLVINQVKVDHVAKGEQIIKYLKEAKALIERFGSFEINATLEMQITKSMP